MEKICAAFFSPFISIMVRERVVELVTVCKFLFANLLCCLLFCRFVIVDGKMYDKMVTDNGHWNYCSSILRRKGRKRWQKDAEETATMSWSSTERSTLPNNHFFLGSRLLQSVVQQPRENQFKGVVRMMYGYGCCLSVKTVLWFLLAFVCVNYSSLPSACAATQDIRVAIPSSVSSSPPRIISRGYVSSARNGGKLLLNLYIFEKNMLVGIIL